MAEDLSYAMQCAMLLHFAPLVGHCYRQTYEYNNSKWGSARHRRHEGPNGRQYCTIPAQMWVGYSFVALDSKQGKLLAQAQERQGAQSRTLKKKESEEHEIMWCAS